MSRSHLLDHLRDYLPNHERAAFLASYGFKSVSIGLQRSPFRVNLRRQHYAFAVFGQ